MDRSKLFTNTKKRRPRRKRLYIHLLNDEVNSFEFVIHILMSICNHNAIQAEQCAMIVHNTGSVIVDSGFSPDIFVTYSALIKNGLSVEIKTKKS
jgi:ATP-dependent Clp protease adaptor protein ClpS